MGRRQKLTKLVRVQLLQLEPFCADLVVQPCILAYHEAPGSGIERVGKVARARRDGGARPVDGRDLAALLGEGIRVAGEDVASEVGLEAVGELAKERVTESQRVRQARRVEVGRQIQSMQAQPARVLQVPGLARVRLGQRQDVADEARVADDVVDAVAQRRGGRVDGAHERRRGREAREQRAGPPVKVGFVFDVGREDVGFLGHVADDDRVDALPVVARHEFEGGELAHKGAVR